MGKMKKILIVIAVLALVGGTLYGLNFFHVLNLSPLIDKLPWGGSASPAQIEVQKLKEENDTLKTSLHKQEEQIHRLELDLKKAEKHENDFKRTEKVYQEEIIKLNEQIAATAAPGSQTKNQSYKNMAQYFSEMNAKEGADLLSRLKDEDIIGILSAMEADSAAELLQKMPRDKAARVTSQMMEADSL